jgi:TPR repeat protein
MPVEHDEYLAGQAMNAGAYEEAVRLLRPLAERNSEYALLALGWIYETGATGAPDRNAARTYYEGAAAQSSATAYLYLGKLLLRDRREMDARAAFETGAQLNNDECKSELARLADEADEELARKAIEEKAYEEAVRLLRPLAERNSERALIALGWIFERGDTGAPDWKAARSYYERAASQGSTAGCFELGRLLNRQGEEAQARAAFEAGAERGHLPSMSRLGTMMIEGRGGPTDLDVGTSWLERAAADGHIFARRKLLAAEARNAKSIFKKLAVTMKIVALAIKGAKEMSKDPNSDKGR